MAMVLGRAVDRLVTFLRAAGFGDSSSLDEPIKMPAHVIYLHWGFTTPVETLEWDLTIHVDPGTAVGEYLALFNGSVDGAQCYLGLQTNVSDPGTGRGIGKGLIFSTWSSFDESDSRIAADGFRELGTHEGRFLGIRKPFQWTTGDYRITLSRAESEVVDGRGMDWFDLSVTPIGAFTPDLSRPAPVGPSVWVGGLRFPRRLPHTAATVQPGGLLFLEVYSGARTWLDVTRWHLDVMAYGDGVRCPSGRTEYPRFPHAQRMPNVNVGYDPTRGRAVLELGSGVVKKDPPGAWRGSAVEE